MRSLLIVSQRTRARWRKLQMHALASRTGEKLTRENVIGATSGFMANAYICTNQLFSEYCTCYSYMSNHVLNRVDIFSSYEIL